MEAFTVEDRLTRRVGLLLAVCVAASVLLLTSEPDEAAADGAGATTPHCQLATVGDKCHSTHTWTGKKIATLSKAGEPSHSADCPPNATGKPSSAAASAAVSGNSCPNPNWEWGWSISGTYVQTVKVVGPQTQMGTHPTTTLSNATTTTTTQAIATGCTGIQHAHGWYGHASGPPTSCHVHSCNWLLSNLSHQRSRNCNWPTTTTSTTSTTSTTTTRPPATTTTLAPPPGCPPGQHSHTSNGVGCHSHPVPNNPSCGDTYQRINGAGHVTRVVRSVPPCPTTTTTTTTTQPSDHDYAASGL